MSLLYSYCDSFFPRIADIKVRARDNCSICESLVCSPEKDCAVALGEHLPLCLNVFIFNAESAGHVRASSLKFVLRHTNKSNDDRTY